MYDVLLLASLLVLVAVTAWYVRQPACSVFHPVTFYLAFHGLLFVIRPVMARIYDYRLIYDVYQFEPAISDKVTVILAANLGLIAFVAAALRTGRDPFQFAQGPLDLRQRAMLVAPMWWSVAICAPIAVASLLQNFAQAASGTQTMVSDAATRITINTTGNGYFFESQNMLVPVCLLIAWTNRFRWWSLLPLATFVIARAGTGGRGPFVTATIAVALAWLYDRRARWPNLRAMGVIAAIMISFATVGVDRGKTIRELFVTDSSAELGRRDLAPLEGMDFGNLEYFEFIVHTIPAKTGSYDYFVNNLMLFTEPIPRVLWKDKPLGQPIKMYDLFRYGNPVGMTSSLPGMGWSQLGWVGVVGWCGLFGGVLGWIYRRFNDARQSNYACAAYFVLLAMLIVGLRDGGLVTFARQGIFHYAPILLWLGLARFMGVPGMPELRALAARRLARRGEIPPPAIPEPAVPRSRRQPAAAPIVPRSARGNLEDLAPRAWRGRDPLSPVK